MYLLDKDLYYIMNRIVPEDTCLNHAIIEQIQEGEIYVDNTEQPESYFIRNSSGAYYIGGNLNNKQFREQLAAYLKNKENHKIYYDLYASSSEWIDYMEKELSGVVRLGRLNFQYNEKSCTEKIQAIDLPESFRLVALDEKLYERYVSEVDDSYAMIFSSAHDFANAASIHLAKKCGFEKTYEEEELWWHEDKWQIEQYLKRYGYTE